MEINVGALTVTGQIKGNLTVGALLLTSPVTTIQPTLTVAV